MRPASQERALDQQAHALIARLCGGLSPFPLAFAWADWAAHLAISPGRQFKLAEHAIGEAQKLWADALPGRDRAPPCLAALDGDRRFMDEAWMLWPYCQLAKAHLAIERWWGEASRDVHGARPESLALVGFVGRQLLDLAAPSNALITNPEAILRALNTKGQSLHEGFRHWLEDLDVLAGKSRPAGTGEFVVGEAVATTPGKIVARTSLAEIIQYTATTERVHAEPIVIVPAWIMKYYILDLAPGESLISYLVSQGFTVFCISWKNPGAEDGALSLDDYRVDGVLAALDAVNKITDGAPVHGVGYCLGGTILAIAAAALDRDQNSPLCTLSLLAAQTDFAEAGELTMFIDESQVAALEDMMDRQGYLDARQMAGAFYALRANDMLWARLVERYLIGARRPASALDAWLMDATRMPALMHSQYLRWLFLENRFTQGNLDIDGSAAALKDIKTPIFAVGAELDHIAPWRSVYKIALFSGAETTFVLSGGGHNTAIVSPPGKPRAHYRVQSVGSCANYVDPDEWLPHTPLCQGSWWPEWLGWLQAHSTADLVARPDMGARELGPLLDPAPGLYVRQR